MARTRTTFIGLAALAATVVPAGFAGAEEAETSTIAVIHGIPGNDIGLNNCPSTSR
ncbi:MAG: hypothetical protein R2755_17735 [Acidimicrobiales bacterium]